MKSSVNVSQQCSSWILTPNNWKYVWTIWSMTRSPSSRWAFICVKTLLSWICTFYWMVLILPHFAEVPNNCTDVCVVDQTNLGLWPTPGNLAIYPFQWLLSFGYLACLRPLATSQTKSSWKTYGNGIYDDSGYCSGWVTLIVEKFRKHKTAAAALYSISPQKQHKIMRNVRPTVRRLNFSPLTAQSRTKYHSYQIYILSKVPRP